MPFPLISYPISYHSNDYATVGSEVCSGEPPHKITYAYEQAPELYIYYIILYYIILYYIILYYLNNDVDNLQYEADIMYHNPNSLTKDNFVKELIDHFIMHHKVFYYAS